MGSPFEYGSKSRAKLDTCHDALKAVATRALELSPVDITIVHGYRGEEVQNALFESGASKLKYPDSMHNKTNVDGAQCSLALDFAPWIDVGIPWEDTHMFAVVYGCFAAAAKERGVAIRWGSDWDGDNRTTDHSFLDWGHIELVDTGNGYRI